MLRTTSESDTQRSLHRAPASVFAALTRGTKAGQIAIRKNCYVLRREQLPIYVEEVLQRQLASGLNINWCPRPIITLVK